MGDARERARSLKCWSGPVDPRPVCGGLTNANFSVEDAQERFFVRIGDDIAVHGVMRFNEVAASRAGHAAGLSPEVVHQEPGALVLRFLEGRTLTEADVREDAMLERLVPLVRRCHEEIPRHLDSAALCFWVFQVNRVYARNILADGHRRAGELHRLLEIGSALESAVGPVRLVFGHNDLLAANFMDDGERVWLIDWDYAGFNSPLFDLGGLASNSGLSPDQEAWMLETYFGSAPDAALWRRYAAMKCASLLREALWSMVSEIHLVHDFDYAAYTAENLDRFERAWSRFQAER